MAVAWITYAAYYLGRLNFSVALPDIQASLNLSKGELGLIGAGFFWVYAVGQLINGYLGDRLSPRRLVLLGMLASAVLTFTFGVVSTWALLFVLWTANGYFQSTGWGPILRVLANWLTPAQRTRISGVFGSSYVAGSALTLLLSGWLVAQFGWRAAFWVPALLLCLAAVGWRLLIQDTPEAAGHIPIVVGMAATMKETQTPGSLLASLRRVWPLMLAAICSGFTLFPSPSGCRRTLSK